MTVNEPHEVVAANLRALKAYYQRTDDQIAHEMGQKRSWVQERMSGARECKVDDLAAFAEYFGIEPGKFFQKAPIILVVSTTGQMELDYDSVDPNLWVVKAS